MCKCKQGELKSVNPATNLVPWLPAVNASQSALIKVTVWTLPVGYLYHPTMKSISAAKPQDKALKGAAYIKGGRTWFNCTN